ncbi:uncharacterized protein V1516DRAFT_190986 [Lipomyces oligophaga]|uniref:uncharacterized protein n=1 Tax=Lipomyces oligophaga TaxID=45792 RepID=UPI0034CE51F7
MASVDLKVKKDALVAALTQLSNAAQDASRACIDFYSAANLPGNPPLFAVPAVVEAAVIADAVVEGTAVEQKKAQVTTSSGEAEAEGDGDVEDKVGRRKQRRRERDPDAPKRPQTMYFAFANEARKIIREEFAARGIEVANADIIHEVSERWNNLTEEQKEPWKAMYAEQIRKYQSAKLAYEHDKEASAHGGLKSELATVEDSPGKKNAKGKPGPKPKTTQKTKTPKTGPVVSNIEVTDAAEPAAEPATEGEIAVVPESPSKRNRKKHKRESEMQAPPTPAKADETVATQSQTPKDKKRRVRKKSEVGKE